MNRKTKIVCTLGPASKETKTLVKMIKAGMNVARLNFSHGDYNSQQSLVNNLREAEKISGQTVIILQDLQGPKIRIGKMPDGGVKIALGEKFVLDTGLDAFQTIQDQKVIPVQYKHLHKDVKSGDIILIEDGMIKTEVIKVSGTAITVKALTPAVIKSHKGINVPTASISADPLTPKDLKDLQFGLKMGVDYVALSFVRHASDITRLRQIIQKAKSTTRIVAKIERHEALQNIEAIIAETDAVMVARGDLGVETPAEAVPIAQKNMVKLATAQGKPVIVATEMLQSMIENPRATRAEVSDVANAVFDHSDAVMLSNETATGKYPVEAISTMARVASTVEQFQKTNNWNKLKYFSYSESDPSEICHTATSLAEETKSKMIVAITTHGFTARQVSKQRTFVEIVAITPHLHVQRELQLSWGISKVLVAKIKTVNAAIELLKKQKLVKKGDKIVLVSNAASTSREIMLKQI